MVQLHAPILIILERFANDVIKAYYAGAADVRSKFFYYQVACAGI